MHRCLQIHEVLEMTLGNLTPENRIDSKGLTCLARTSKLFHDPALDILWKTQNTVANLLRCMPADVVKIHYFQPQTPYKKAELRLLRPIMASDWERPRLYNRCVKILASLPNTSVSASDILPALAMSLPFDSVFPELTDLSWVSGFEQDFDYIRLFLAQGLTKIRIHCDDSFDQLSLLSVLDRKCSSLTDVTIYTGDILEEVSPWIGMILSALVRGQRNLHSLAIQMTDMAALEHVALL
ncbi:hypothetical protein B0H16DRAFT_1454785 [Mycena metata]|uniref:F-box domain-containing protein n=1 Tax=Mycena metata TaxID=1033252 RepID=A0AAD7JK65_9AGAR|nr:hypothetical protein B0H16DRAFT_1454785 [Mycena metata]